MLFALFIIGLFLLYVYNEINKSSSNVDFYSSFENNVKEANILTLERIGVKMYHEKGHYGGRYPNSRFPEQTLIKIGVVSDYIPPHTYLTQYFERRYPFPSPKKDEDKNEGLYICGVIRTIAPKATIISYNIKDNQAFDKIITDKPDIVILTCPLPDELKIYISSLQRLGIFIILPSSQENVLIGNLEKDKYIAVKDEGKGVSIYNKDVYGCGLYHRYVKGEGILASIGLIGGIFCILFGISKLKAPNISNNQRIKEVLNYIYTKCIREYNHPVNDLPHDLYLKAKFIYKEYEEYISIKSLSNPIQTRSTEEIQNSIYQTFKTIDGLYFSRDADTLAEKIQEFKMFLYKISSQTLDSKDGIIDLNLFPL